MTNDTIVLISNRLHIQSKSMLVWIYLLMNKVAKLEFFIIFLFKSFTTIWFYLKFIELFSLRQGFPCGSADKESACNAGDLSLIPGLGRSPVEGKGYPLQYSGLENSMEYIVHGVAKSWKQLRDFHFTSTLNKTSVY